MTSNCSLYALDVKPDTIDGGYIITCPLIPGVVTQAQDLDQVTSQGWYAIQTMICYLMLHGEPIPAAIPSQSATHFVELPPAQAAEIAAYNASLV